MNLSSVDKVKIPSTREEWLKQRRKGIGGSDAGAICGLNPYKSAYTLWAEKSGMINDEVPDNEAMRLGRDLEDYVAKRFCEATGKRVKKSNFSFRSKEHPFMLANVDRLIIGEDAGLECKTTNMLSKVDYASGDIPPSYYAQCQHYMAVTGAFKWYIAILQMNKGFYWYEISRDQEEIDALIEAEEIFWKHIEQNTEPEIDCSDSTAETIYKLHPLDNGEAVTIYRDEEAARLDELKDLEKDIKEQIRGLESRIKNDIGEAQVGYSGNWKFTYKTVSRNSIDSKKLKAEYPQIYEKCLKASTSRRFTVKRI